MAYEVVLKPSAKRALDALPETIKARLIGAMELLVENPWCRGVIKLKAETDLYRVRVGSYRIVFTVTEEQLVVLVLKIGHRRDIYR